MNFGNFGLTDTKFARVPAVHETTMSDDTSTYLDKGITQAVSLRFLSDNLDVLYRTSRFKEVQQLFFHQVGWDVVNDQVTATRQVLLDHF